MASSQQAKQIVPDLLPLLVLLNSAEEGRGQIHPLADPKFSESVSGDSDEEGLLMKQREAVLSLFLSPDGGDLNRQLYRRLVLRTHRRHRSPASLRLNRSPDRKSVV